jgi:hypothetical protein
MMTGGLLVMLGGFFMMRGGLRVMFRNLAFSHGSIPSQIALFGAQVVFKFRLLRIYDLCGVGKVVSTSDQSIFVEPAQPMSFILLLDA